MPQLPVFISDQRTPGKETVTEPHMTHPLSEEKDICPAPFMSSQLSLLFCLAQPLTAWMLTSRITVFDGRRCGNVIMAMVVLGSITWKSLPWFISFSSIKPTWLLFVKSLTLQSKQVHTTLLNSYSKWPKNYILRPICRDESPMATCPRSHCHYIKPGFPWWFRW